MYTALTRLSKCSQSCTRPVRGRVHGPFTAVYTAVYTRIRVHRRYKAMYAPYTRPCAPPVHCRIHGPCTRLRTRPVVYMAGRPTGPRRHATAVYGPSRPSTRPVHGLVYGRVRRPFHVYGRVRRPLHGRPTRAYVYTAVKMSCTVRVMYTSVYTASTQSCTWRVGLRGRVHGPRRHFTAVGRVHGRNASCTRSCTRLIHSLVHLRLHGPCTRPRTRTVCRNGPHTAVACRLGTCARPGRPTCRIHGPDDLVHGLVTAEYTGRYTAV